MKRIEKFKYIHVFDKIKKKLLDVEVDAKNNSNILKFLTNFSNVKIKKAYMK
jgi:hypothetical protein